MLKEVKYATHKNSTETYVFDVLVKHILEMSCRLLVAYDEMRKRHFIDKINVKTPKSIEKAICDVNVGAVWRMPNFVYIWLSDVDLTMCNNNLGHCILGCHHVPLKLVNGMHKCTIMNNGPLTSFILFNVGRFVLIRNIRYLSNQQTIPHAMQATVTSQVVKILGT